MKLHGITMIGIALFAMGCAEKEAPVPEQAPEMQTTAPEVETPPAEGKSWHSDEFLEHMHVHADKLDELVLALANGDLETAKMQAYWLSRHKKVSGMPSEWQPFLDGMRAAALAVETAPDLEAARAPAERITEQCQGCHAAAGVLSK